ncbi:hypothetical protein AVEN_162013-1 [Araneus ventricosus]|uniref:Uncharacterized protein n=1 Tax=Araneus ventricosus TaxID=182803 RepID=A0A4Y2F6S8_ARAVE|nr:hypothetical protein AVEN_162013-1 [Araneus ventricosus]
MHGDCVSGWGRISGGLAAPCGRQLKLTRMVVVYLSLLAAPYFSVSQALLLDLGGYGKVKLAVNDIHNLLPVSQPFILQKFITVLSIWIQADCTC